MASGASSSEAATAASTSEVVGTRAPPWRGPNVTERLLVVAGGGGGGVGQGTEPSLKNGWRLHHRVRPTTARERMGHSEPELLITWGPSTPSVLQRRGLRLTLRIVTDGKSGALDGGGGGARRGSSSAGGMNANVLPVRLCPLTSTWLASCWKHVFTTPTTDQTMAANQALGASASMRTSSGGMLRVSPRAAKAARGSPAAVALMLAAELCRHVSVEGFGVDDVHRKDWHLARQMEVAGRLAWRRGRRRCRVMSPPPPGGPPPAPRPLLLPWKKGGKQRHELVAQQSIDLQRAQPVTNHLHAPYDHSASSTAPLFTERWRQQQQQLDAAVALRSNQQLTRAAAALAISSSPLLVLPGYWPADKVGAAKRQMHAAMAACSRAGDGGDRRVFGVESRVSHNACILPAPMRMHSMYRVRRDS